MKHRIFYFLCYLCAVCALAVPYEGSEAPEWRDGLVPDSSELGDSQEANIFSNLNNTRDKRALGLFLSGLAQIFGYTVSPVQLASLTNGNPEPDRGSNRQSANSNPANSTQSTPSTIAAPRQKETIKFTGVLNLGNNTDLLNHLQQYERLFHGSNNNATSGTPGTAATPSTPAQGDPRIVNSGPVSPFLVNLPLPSMRQPPLPEIPPENISLSYPRPFIPVQNAQRVEIRKNENTEKLMVENKEIQSPMEVRSPPAPYTPFYVTNTDEPRWKKEHEERIAELERKQMEHSERLRMQEQYRNHVRDHYNQKVKKDHSDGDPTCREDGNEKDVGSKEVEDSREKFGSPERAPLSQNNQGRITNFKDFENDSANFKQYDDSPQTDDNYANVKYDEPLPISEDDEQRRPEELRNSYGEPVNSRDLIEDGFLRYFGKLKDSIDDFYESESPNSKEDLKQEHFRNSNEDENLPANNKYEEYSLEEGDLKRKRTEDSGEDSDSFAENPSKATFNNEKQRSSKEMDLSGYVPVVVPVRYLGVPEEIKETKSRFSVTDKSDKINNNRETSKKSSSKESKAGKNESLTPKISFPGRRTPKKLHEGEQKELQMWPPPFDIVLDSTIQTSVTAKPDNSSVYVIRKPDDGIDEEKSPRERKTRTFVDPAQRYHDFHDNAYYQRFKDDPRARSGLSKRTTFALSDSINLEDAKLRQRKNVADIWKRYKYNANNNYKSGELKVNTEHNPSSNHSKRTESPNYNTAKIEPNLGNDYGRIYSRNRQGFQLLVQKPMPRTDFVGPMDADRFSNFG